jgi:hypothetical protein
MTTMWDDEVSSAPMQKSLIDGRFQAKSSETARQ